MILKNRAIFGSGLFLLILAGSVVVGQYERHSSSMHNTNGATDHMQHTATDMHAQDDAASKKNAMDHHMHVLYDVSHMELAPDLSLRILPDAMSGWNIHLMTKNFVFAPTQVNQKPVDGEGHAHLYVNEQKVARIYGPWYHLDGLAPGEYAVKVQLNGNDHATLAMGANPIEVIGLVTQPEMP